MREVENYCLVLAPQSNLWQTELHRCNTSSLAKSKFEGLETQCIDTYRCNYSTQSAGDHIAKEIISRCILRATGISFQIPVALTCWDQPSIRFYKTWPQT